MRIEHVRFCNVIAMAKSTIGHLRQKQRHKSICRHAGCAARTLVHSLPAAGPYVQETLSQTHQEKGFSKGYKRRHTQMNAQGSHHQAQRTVITMPGTGHIAVLKQFARVRSMSRHICYSSRGLRCCRRVRCLTSAGSVPTPLASAKSPKGPPVWRRQPRVPLQGRVPVQQCLPVTEARQAVQVPQRKRLAGGRHLLREAVGVAQGQDLRV